MSDPTVPHPALGRTRLAADLLDDAIPVPLTDRRVGLDPLLGVLPIAGDTAATIVSLYIVVEAALAGVPRLTLFRMLLNVLLDVAVGSIPVVGDLFDAFWKANRRNVALMERHLDAAAAE